MPVDLRYRGEAPLCDGLAIRDTSIHTPVTDPTVLLWVARISREAFPTPALIIVNELNQDVLVSLRGARYENHADEGRLFDVTISAGATRWYTEAYSTIMRAAIPKMALQLSCAIAPSTGVVRAYLQTSD